MGCEDCRCQEGVGATLDDYEEEVCEVLRPRCEPRLVCEYPLRVEGHCCHYCGGRIRVSSNHPPLATLKRLVRRLLRSSSLMVDWHVRVVNRPPNSDDEDEDDQIEILLTDKGGYSAYRGTDTLLALHYLESRLKGLLLFFHFISFHISFLRSFHFPSVLALDEYAQSMKILYTESSGGRLGDSGRLAVALSSISMSLLLTLLLFLLVFANSGYTLQQ